jgi:hypothetical protein
MHRISPVMFKVMFGKGFITTGSEKVVNEGEIVSGPS